MIVVENILATIFDQLPDVVDSKGNYFKPKFSWGSQKDLNKYMLSLRKNTPYPLIWLVSNSQNETNGEIIKSLRLILAMNSSKTESINPDVWNTDFTTSLNPLLENVKKALQMSGVTFVVTKSDVRYKIERIANYSESQEGNENFTIDNWNVIILECDVNFQGNQNCIRTINFN